MKGYKIAIPVQRNPWCLHDDGRLSDLAKYENRPSSYFYKKYQNMLGKNIIRLGNKILGSEEVF